MRKQQIQNVLKVCKFSGVISMIIVGLSARTIFFREKPQWDITGITADPPVGRSVILPEIDLTAVTENMFQGSDGLMAKVNVNALERFRVAAVMTGDNGYTVLEDRSTGQTTFLSCGQSIQGFRLDSVTAGKLVLTAADQKIELLVKD